MSSTRSVAVVTGAGRREGIGYEVARQLAAHGMHVVLTARQLTAAEARSDELAASGLSVEGAELDITNAAHVDRLAQRIGARHGHLDVLINNAATTATYDERPSTADLDNARKNLETTLLGTWRITQALIPLLLKSKNPRIVNVSSGAGSHGDPSFGLGSQNSMGPSYAIAKAALNALTDVLAQELKSQGVLVNAVCPGFTATFPGGEQMGARPVQDGAASVVWAALLPASGPYGGFFRDGTLLPW